MFHPRLLDIVKEGYCFAYFRKDLLAGLTVAIVAIPLSIAFAIASGATPIVGIYTAVIGSLVSFFGGSKYNISGPAGAFIGIIYTTIAHFGYNGLLISTFLAGLFIMFFAVLKLGKLMKYIPNCIIIGFSFGLGVDIFSGQISDFLGLTVHGGETFTKKILICFQNLDQLRYNDVILGFIAIFTAVVVRKIKPSLPAFLIAIIVSSMFAKIFNFHSETIESRFGIMHLTMPSFHESILHEIEHPFYILHYIPNALSISILASIEALLAAIIADKMTNEYHRPNTELFSLGIANCLSALFGCIPIAGTTARTIVNVKSGSKSPLSGIFHGIFLIILMAIFAEIISNVNMSTIAGILIVVATDMMSFKKIVNVCKTSNKFDIIIMFFTCISVLLFGLVMAIIINTICYNAYIKILRFVKKKFYSR